MFTLILTTIFVVVTSEHATPKYQTIIQSTFPINGPITLAGSGDVLWPLIPVTENQITYVNGLKLIKITKIPIEEKQRRDESNLDAHQTHLLVTDRLSDFNDFGSKTNDFQPPQPIHEPDVTFLRPTFLFRSPDLEAPRVEYSKPSTFNKISVDDFRDSPFKKIVANALGAVQDPITKFTFPATNYGVPILTTKYALPTPNVMKSYTPGEFSLPGTSDQKSFVEPGVKFQRPQFVFDEQEKRQYGLPKVVAKFNFKGDLVKEQSVQFDEKFNDGVVYGLPYFKPGFFKHEHEWRLKAEASGKTKSEFGVPVLNVPKTSYDVPIF